MNNYPEGKFFSEELMAEIKDKFYYVDECPIMGKRLFFDNAGGSFRLKEAVKVQSELEQIPDCPERTHDVSYYLQKKMKEGEDAFRIMLNAGNKGSMVTSLTASQAMFKIVGTIAENVGGDNIVTSVLEHPSAFDAARYFAEKTGRELRVADSNPLNGKVDPKEVVKLIDENTVLLNVMYASNLTGGIFDIEEIVKEARKVKKDLYIVIDAVQHAPHGIIDLQKYDIDGINFGMYKFYGTRGSGLGYVSDRVSKLRHEKLIHREDEVWALGTPVPSQFAVIKAIFDYVSWIGRKFTDSENKREIFVEGMNRIKLQERALLNRLLNGSEKVQGLRDQKNVQVFLDSKDLTTRDLIIAMGFTNIDCTTAAKEYEKRKVIVAPRLESSMYSKRMLESFDIKDGVLRVSPLHCNSSNDIDKFLEITKEIANL